MEHKLPNVLSIRDRKPDRGGAQTFERDLARIARLEIIQTGIGPAGDDLASAHAALGPPHIRQFHRHAQGVAKGMTAVLARDRLAVHR